MKAWNSLLSISVSLVCQGIYSQAPSRTIELEAALFARLRYEILWQDADVDRESTTPKQTTAAIWTNAKVLAYCSLELQRCAEYELSGRRLGDRLRVRSNSSKDSNLDSLWGFVPVKTKAAKPEDPAPMFEGGRRGQFDSDSGITWFAQREIGTREEIIADYAKLRPPRLQEVLTHLKESDHSAYTSMTVACFAGEDELVYVHGVRPKLGEIVFSLRWDEEAGWRTAGMVEMPFDPATTTRLRNIIKSMPCGEIQFQARDPRRSVRPAKDGAADALIAMPSQPDSAGSHRADGSSIPIRASFGRSMSGGRDG